MEQIHGNAADIREFFPASLGGEERQRLSFWNTPESLAEHVGTLSRDSAWYPEAWRTGEVDFFGAADMATACQMAREGWPEGAERATRLRDRINAAHPIGPRLVKWDVAGAYPSIGRALSGDPMNMRRIDSTRLRRKPVITLMSDFACSYNVAGNALTNRAAVVAAIVDAIEGAGFSCQVIGFECTAMNDCFQLCAATIKEPNQAADIGRMAYALGHAAMFRRLTWATIVEDSWIQNLTCCLGVPREISFADIPEVYCIESVNTCEAYFINEDMAATRGLDRLIAGLQAQGCPAFPAIENDTTTIPVPPSMPAPLPRLRSKKRRRRRYQ